MEPRQPILDAASAQALFAALATAPVEVVGVAYLDPKWRLLALRHVAGQRGRVQPSIRAIVRDALAFDAAALIVAHNHPSGDPEPSAEDISFTRLCARTMHAIDVCLSDHLILAGSRWTSFRDRGLL